MTSSASKFGRDHGLIHEAVVTGRKASWTEKEWSRLAHDEEVMREFRNVLLGYSEIVTSKRQPTVSLEEMCRQLLEVAVADGLVKMAEGVRQPLRMSNGDLIAVANRLSSLLHSDHIIDCDADPYIPDDWSVEEHQKGGAFKWDKEAQTDALHLDKRQKYGEWIEGNELREALAGKSVLNANVLDYLIAHPHLMPEEWKGKIIFFWGTIYRNRGGYRCVRCLFWYSDSWCGSSRWLGSVWLDHNPAAVSPVQCSPFIRWAYS